MPQDVDSTHPRQRADRQHGDTRCKSPESPPTSCKPAWAISSFGWSQRVGNGRQTAICVVDTDAGIQGFGEAFYFGGPATVVADLIDRGLGPHVIGCDPMDSSVIWDKLYNLTRDQGQKGVTVSAISAVDIALWDIKGKALGLPVTSSWAVPTAGQAALCDRTL